MARVCLSDSCTRDAEHSMLNASVCIFAHGMLDNNIMCIIPFAMTSTSLAQHNAMDAFCVSMLHVHSYMIAQVL
jgi:hypothetical protein